MYTNTICVQGEFEEEEEEESNDDQRLIKHHITSHVTSQVKCPHMDYGLCVCSAAQDHKNEYV